MDKYITIEEAAKKLGKSVEDVRAMANSGKLRSIMSGGMKFKESDIAALAGDAKEDTLMTIDSDVLFAEGEGEQPADAAAETWIAADMENVFESEDFKAGGRGAEPAPLPLSPEKDDTALGTVLMENEGPGGGQGDEPVIAIDPESGIATITAPTPGISRTHMIVVSEPEPRHKAFTPLLVISIIALGFSLVTVLAMTMAEGMMPPYLEDMSKNLMAFIGLGFGIALIAFVVGFVLDSQKAKAQAAAARFAK